MDLIDAILDENIHEILDIYITDKLKEKGIDLDKPVPLFKTYALEVQAINYLINGYQGYPSIICLFDSFCEQLDSIIIELDSTETAKVLENHVIQILCDYIAQNFNIEMLDNLMLSPNSDWEPPSFYYNLLYSSTFVKTMYSLYAQHQNSNFMNVFLQDYIEYYNDENSNSFLTQSTELFNHFKVFLKTFRKLFFQYNQSELISDFGKIFAEQICSTESCYIYAQAILHSLKTIDSSFTCCRSLIQICYKYVQEQNQQNCALLILLGTSLVCYPRLFDIVRAMMTRKHDSALDIQLNILPVFVYELKRVLRKFLQYKSLLGFFESDDKILASDMNIENLDCIVSNLDTFHELKEELNCCSLTSTVYDNSTMYKKNLADNLPNKTIEDVRWPPAADTRRSNALSIIWDLPSASQVGIDGLNNFEDIKELERRGLMDLNLPPLSALRETNLLEILCLIICCPLKYKFCRHIVNEHINSIIESILLLSTLTEYELVVMHIQEEQLLYKEADENSNNNSVIDLNFYPSIHDCDNNNYGNSCYTMNNFNECNCGYLDDALNSNTLNLIGQLNLDTNYYHYNHAPNNQISTSIAESSNNNLFHTNISAEQQEKFETNSKINTQLPSNAFTINYSNSSYIGIPSQAEFIGVREFQAFQLIYLMNNNYFTQDNEIEKTCRKVKTTNEYNFTKTLNDKKYKEFNQTQFNNLQTTTPIKTIFDNNRNSNEHSSSVVHSNGESGSINSLEDKQNNMNNQHGKPISVVSYFVYKSIAPSIIQSNIYKNPYEKLKLKPIANNDKERKEHIKSMFENCHKINEKYISIAKYELLVLYQAIDKYKNDHNCLCIEKLKIFINNCNASISSNIILRNIDSCLFNEAFDKYCPLDYYSDALQSLLLLIALNHPQNRHIVINIFAKIIESSYQHAYQYNNYGYKDRKKLLLCLLFNLTLNDIPKLINTDDLLPIHSVIRDWVYVVGSVYEKVFVSLELLNHQFDHELLHFILYFLATTIDLPFEFDFAKRYLQYIQYMTENIDKRILQNLVQTNQYLFIHIINQLETYFKTIVHDSTSLIVIEKILTMLNQLK